MTECLGATSSGDPLAVRAKLEDRRRDFGVPVATPSSRHNLGGTGRVACFHETTHLEIGITMSLPLFRRPGRISQTQKPGRPRPRRRSIRPSLDALEDRLLLSTIAVTNNGDDQHISDMATIDDVKQS